MLNILNSCPRELSFRSELVLLRDFFYNIKIQPSVKYSSSGDAFIHLHDDKTYAGEGAVPLSSRYRLYTTSKKYPSRTTQENKTY